ncbi:MAG: IS1595 family transposase [Chitinophagaceae bacterium]|nr:IS1595 family transposase [Chitinophagaceae bacterium]
MLERDGRVLTKIIDKATSEHVEPHIRGNIEFAANLYTDAANMYKRFNDAYYHNSVNHDKNEFVRGKVHTNTIESFWSHLKRTIKGTHIHVSTKYLPLYMDEVSFKWEYRRKDGRMFDFILGKVAS